jgi:dissimilatory sulfite reductase (desulfoviridin) alpha/beta subunit
MSVGRLFFGYKVFIGGAFGKNIIASKQYTPIITDMKTLFQIIDAGMLYFSEFVKTKGKTAIYIKKNGNNQLRIDRRNH